MRIVAQRVFEASVSVQGKVISKIGRGLLILVGMTKGDNADTIDHMSSKTVNMRLWECEGKSWAASVKDIQGEILIVSQFTLFGIFKGNKPDFHGALGANEARELYELYVEAVRKKYLPNRIQTGQFQTRMVVSSANDGPVTMIYEKKPDGKEVIEEKEQI